MPESDASRSEFKLIPSESTALGEVLPIPAPRYEPTSADGERAPPMSQRIQRRPRHHFSPGSSDCDHFARANTARVSSGAVRWPAMSSGQPSTSAAAHSAHCATSA
jgi:hypothetical protein